MSRKFKTDEAVETKVRSWTIGKSPVKGTRFVRVQFEHYISWKGYFTPKTEAKTMETLEFLGFKGSNLRMIAEPGALDVTKNVLAIIGESREYKGNTYYDAKWINDPERALGGYSDRNITEDMLDEFNMDTSGYIQDSVDLSSPAASQRTPAPTPTAGTDLRSRTTVQDNGFSADDIPF